MKENRHLKDVHKNNTTAIQFTFITMFDEANYHRWLPPTDQNDYILLNEKNNNLQYLHCEYGSTVSTDKPPGSPSIYVLHFANSFTMLYSL